jgi:hypothetical protein
LSPDRFESALARWERALIFAIFAASTILQLNGVLHHGFMGQDWRSNAESAAQALQMPAPRWIVYVGVNAPALFWLSALVRYATGSTAYIATTSFVLVLANTVALCVWWRLAKATIQAPSVRLAALVTLAFLPCRIIHSTVFAGDAVVVLPFTLVLWLTYELLRVADARRQAKLAVAVSVALLAGISSRYTMASAVPVALLLLLALRRAFPSRKVLAGALLLVVIVPGLLAAHYHHIYTHLPSADGRRAFWNHDMDWRSLLMLRAADVDVLRAPQYLDKVSLGGVEVENLLSSNRHSYPALLHLSLFTDVLNIFQSDPSDSDFGVRDALHQQLMTLAVRSAIPLSLLMICATAVYLLRAVSYVRRLRAGAADGSLPTLIVLAFSVAFFANIALFLPFVQLAYHNGYWLSRLVIPALMGSCLLGFTFLDERLRSSGARLTLLAYATAQAALHASFLWMRGP